MEEVQKFYNYDANKEEKVIIEICCKNAKEQGYPHVWLAHEHLKYVTEFRLQTEEDIQTERHFRENRILPEERI